MFNSSGGNYFNPGSSQLGGGLGGLASGIFGLFQHPGQPYQAAQNQYNQYMGQGMQYGQPFYQAGVNTLPQYQNALNTMSNPSAYINNLMSQYQQSPWAQWQIQQGIKAGNNAASAGDIQGMQPGGAEQKALAQYSEGISSQDIQNYINNAMGVQNAYLGGLGGITNIGAQQGQDYMNYLQNQAANNAQLTLGGQQAQQQGQSQGWGNIIGGIGSLLGAFL